MTAPKFTPVDLSPAMQRLLLSWRIRAVSINNPTACALERRGLIEWGQAWGSGGHWILTDRGTATRSALAKARGESSA